MCLVIRLNQEYQINKKKGKRGRNGKKTRQKRRKIQFGMPQGVVEGLKGIKLEGKFVESIKKYTTRTKIFNVNFSRFLSQIFENK
jgi:hypothetical protein